MRTPTTPTLFPLFALLLVAVVRGQEPAAPADAPVEAPATAVASDAAVPSAPSAPGESSAATTLADELVAKFRAAGKVGSLQLLLSVIALGVGLESAARLRRKTICPEGLAETAGDALRQGRHPDALAACQAQPSVLADVLTAIVEHHDFGFAEIQSIAADVAARRLKPHATRAYPLAVIASLATLLGLLGTVIGMIGSFEAVALAGSMGDPSIMASQISYALVTTAIGLSVAVPCIALYHILKRRAAGLAAELDEQVSTLISTWQIELRRGTSPARTGA